MNQVPQFLLLLPDSLSSQSGQVSRVEGAQIHIVLVLHQVVEESVSDGSLLRPCTVAS